MPYSYLILNRRVQRFRIKSFVERVYRCMGSYFSRCSVEKVQEEGVFVLVSSEESSLQVDLWGVPRHSLGIELL